MRYLELTKGQLFRQIKERKITLYVVGHDGEIIGKNPIALPQVARMVLTFFPKKIAGYRRIEARNGNGVPLEIQILSNHRGPTEDKYSSLVY